MGLFAKVSWLVGVTKVALSNQRRGGTEVLSSSPSGGGSGAGGGDGTSHAHDYAIGFSTDTAVIRGDGSPVTPGLIPMHSVLQAITKAGLVYHRLNVDPDLKTVLFGIRLHPATLDAARQSSPHVSSAERITLICDLLDTIGIDTLDHRATRIREGLLPRTLLSDGRPLGVVTHALPLHDPVQLKELVNSWRWSLWSQPLDDILDYFGHSIALYFAFLSFYLKWLVPVAVSSTALLAYQAVHSYDNAPTILFCVAVSVWSTVYLKFWSHEEARLSLKWESWGYEVVEHQRREFVGVPQYDPVSQTTHLVDPVWKRGLRGCAVWGVIFCVLVPALLLMVMCERVDQFVEEELHKMYDAAVDPVLGSTTYVRRDGAFPFLPPTLPTWTVNLTTYFSTIAYALIIPVFDSLNTYLAGVLTRFENHRTQHKHDNAHITKLVIFKFFYSYVSLFFIGFYRLNLPLLRKRLGILLIVQLVVQNIQELGVPVMLARFRLASADAKAEAGAEAGAEAEADVDTPPTGGDTPPDAALDQVREQLRMSEYPSTLDDMMEVTLQFGQLSLFAPLFPFVGLLLFVSTWLEITVDATKLGACQRPVPVRAASLGQWKNVLSVLGYLSVISNCALVGIAWQQGTVLPALDPLERVAVCVVLEHLILGFKGFIQLSDVQDEVSSRPAVAPKDDEQEAPSPGFPVSPLHALLSSPGSRVDGGMATPALYSTVQSARLAAAVGRRLDGSPPPVALATDNGGVKLDLPADVAGGGIDADVGRMRPVGGGGGGGGEPSSSSSSSSAALSAAVAAAAAAADGPPTPPAMHPDSFGMRRRRADELPVPPPPVSPYLESPVTVPTGLFDWMTQPRQVNVS